ncbi:hypothetical protein AQI95_23885 [Streptomyces yokosukanensis]|uniref:Uncharacterized protein n=1 Tax=Streptomyces yokosukanensis TaxID=67386 RepID=A0A101P263_9ACTN|nr:hypothetical protein [Streptomyces yokosukanensis]KUN03532.1 hypothetical protein AQI95_23885 [Streptomyces yokosukanensis]
MKAHHRIAVHRLLTETHDRLGGRRPSLGGTVDEVAACLLNLVKPQYVASPFDEDLRSRTGDLDRLPLPECLRLLKAGAACTGT